MFGFNHATTPLLGATLYVVPATGWVVSLVAGGYRQQVPIPNLPSFLSWPAYFQILELDAGAPNGVSFSQGLLVVTGR